MQKKNLSKTYTKKVGLAQVIDDANRDPIIPLSRPVSAGGPSSTPATLSQEYLQFILGIDEVPDWMRSVVWAVITRMNALTIIPDPEDFERLSHGVRAMLRAMMWERKISLKEMNEIEYYVGIQLRRSRGAQQLRWVSPGYQQIIHQESVSHNAVVDERQQGNAAMGLLNKGKGGRGF